MSKFSGVDFGAPAPGELEIVRQFVNSVDFEDGWDRFDDRRSAAQWLSEAAGIQCREQQITAKDVAMLRDLREHLRAILLSHNDGNASSRRDAHEVAARGLALDACFGYEGVSFEPTGTPASQMALLLALAIHQASATGTWQRLKACAKSTCTWAYYDRSKNHSARWCNMRLCGNRVKTRAYRRRLNAL